MNPDTLEIAQIVGELLDPREFPLRVNYTLMAARDLALVHGLDLEEEIMRFLGFAFTSPDFNMELFEIFTKALNES